MSNSTSPSTMSHAEFAEQVEAYLSGGLTPAEHAAFQVHAAACAACNRLLTDAAAADNTLRELFAAAHPADGFEDRLVTRLRTAGTNAAAARRGAGTRSLIHPAVRRAAVGIAATVVLGAVGAVVVNALRENGAGGLRLALLENRAGPAVSASESAVQGLQGGWEWRDGPVAHYGMQDAGAAVAGAPPAPPAESTKEVVTPEKMAQRFNTWAVEQADGETRRRSRAEPDTLAIEAKTQSRQLTVPLGERTDKMGDVTAYFEKTPVAAGGQSGPPADQHDGVMLDVTNGGAVRGLDDAYSPVVVQGKELYANQAHSFAYQYRSPAPKDAKAGVDFDVDASKLGLETAAGAQAGAIAGAGAGGGDGFGNGRGQIEGVDVKLNYAQQAGRGRFRPGEALDQLERDGHKSGGFGLALGANAENALLDTGLAAGQQGQAVQPGTTPAAATGAEPAPAAGDVALAQPAEPPPAPAPDPVEAPKPDAPADAAPAANVQPPPPPAVEEQVAERKIIRNGDMSFEVDGFDSALLQITKIAREEGGFVATTDSEKLPNGKVKGTVVVRVPPERLDTLVLKLRGLGDLKNSRIAAQDITKQYTDLSSQLRAARAMEERLLEIIKTGKGEIKDLLEAEKQLGTWREKIEGLEGEIRYYNNLVSLSTLTVSLFERDIRAAAFAAETEQVSVGVETEDVEKSRASAIEAIETAKGRIIESDLKKLEAGQLSARIVAEVTPAEAGPLIDRLKQLGTVSRLDIERKQTTQAADGTPVPLPQVLPGGKDVLPGLKIERRDTRFIISLYNLANVAPRQNDAVNLAAEDVETAYRAILEQIREAEGRIVTSQLSRPRPDTTTGVISAELPRDKADAVIAAIRTAGEVMRLDVTINPDAQNSTDAKRGISLQIFSLATVAPRETATLSVAAESVASAFNTLRDAVREAGGRVLTSALVENDPNNVSGSLDFEVDRDDYAKLAPALAAAGDVLTRNVTRSADADNTVDSKVRVQVQFVDESQVQPRETVSLQVATKDVRARYAEVLEALRTTKGRSHVLASQLNVGEGGENNVSASLTFNVARADREKVELLLGKESDVFGRTVTRSSDLRNTSDEKVQLTVTLRDADSMPPKQTTTVGVEVDNVARAKGDLETFAVQVKGRSVNPTLSKEASGRTVSVLALEVPLSAAPQMLDRVNSLGGTVRMIQSRTNDAVPEGSLSRARFDVTLANAEMIVAGDESFGRRIKEGLATSASVLLVSVEWVVVGLCVVLPFALVLWLGWLIVRPAKKAKKPAAEPPAAPPPGAMAAAGA